jgi:hypothetical protein
MCARPSPILRLVLVTCPRIMREKTLTTMDLNNNAAPGPLPPRQTHSSSGDIPLQILSSPIPSITHFCRFSFVYVPQWSTLCPFVEHAHDDAHLFPSPKQSMNTTSTALRQPLQPIPTLKSLPSSPPRTSTASLTLALPNLQPVKHDAAPSHPLY